MTSWNLYRAIWFLFAWQARLAVNLSFQALGIAPWSQAPGSVRPTDLSRRGGHRPPSPGSRLEPKSFG
ncbi:hypothetical protein IF1G_06789 [Cordyceps javanica]|uniref:Uncharacterized protein n=1 Tax=Cordyceps javanica TaxID=43265 RepID=A0A545UZ91_9HYPO|nr:hypothetical protein IF1G_06789 [Cordyceps javanica]